MKKSKRKKDIHAIALGRKGGKARLKTMSKRERRQRSLHAINIRWNKR